MKAAPLGREISLFEFPADLLETLTLLVRLLKAILGLLGGRFPFSELRCMERKADESPDISPY